MLRRVEEKVARDAKERDDARAVRVAARQRREAPLVARGVQGLGAAEKETHALRALVAAPGARLAVGHAPDARGRRLRRRGIEEIRHLHPPLIARRLRPLDDASARLERLGVHAGEQPGGARLVSRRSGGARRDAGAAPSPERTRETPRRRGGGGRGGGGRGRTRAARAARGRASARTTTRTSSSGRALSSTSRW